MPEIPESVRRLKEHLGTTNRLQSLGVCQRCLLRIAGETYPATLRNASAILAEHWRPSAESQSEKGSGDLDGVAATLPVCPCCFGLLQEAFCSLAFLTQIQEHVEKSGHTMRTFWCSLTSPNGAEIRARCFDEFWDGVAEKISGRLSVKDAWKAVVTPVLTGFFRTKWVGHDGLEINLAIENAQMDGMECEVLKKRYPQSFQEKRGSDGKMKRVVTRHSLEKILAGMGSYDFNLLFPFPPKTLTKASVVVQISCIPCSVFVAGRYLKYSRSISQTPWFIEEERKGETSVEELICSKLKAAFEAESFKFCASGREDIDVLMLGDGRPFGVELIGAKFAGLTELQMAKLEAQINASHKDIEVKYLSVVERSEMSILKMGEEEKTKSYTALCSMRETVSPCDLTQINQLSNLQIDQRTPIRVLHRRANAQRLKLIYTLAAESVPGNPHQFRLNLKSQAGTYIKEVIHGDFGRTSPSISSLLDKEVECEELDVMCVDLVWPPGRSALTFL